MLLRCNTAAGVWGLLMGILCCAGNALAAATNPIVPAAAAAITNLAQLTAAVLSERRLYREIRLEFTVCEASKPEMGVLVAQDPSGVEWLQFGRLPRKIVSGERFSLHGWHVLARHRELGIELLQGPLIDNDGLHIRRTWGGNIGLKAGRIPIRLDWFNCLRDMHLEVYYLLSNQPPRSLTSSNLWHEVIVAGSGKTNYSPGLLAECYEGYWESVPDFEMLQPVKSGVVSNVDLSFRSRDELVGMRFRGFFDVPYDGTYTFRVRSDEGSLLFFGNPELPLQQVGFTNAPMPVPLSAGEAIPSLTDRRWASFEGRAQFVTRKGRGLELELHSDHEVITVRAADAAGVDTSALLNTKVRVRGLAAAVLTTDQRIVPGTMAVVSGADIMLVDSETPAGTLSPVTSVAQVHALPIETAAKGIPVRLRGVITEARNSAVEKWISLQDDARGIFVHLSAISNAVPAPGELWEVNGRTAAGDFAPVVNAERLTYVGEGRLPEPVRPTWRELANGSMDVQWAELQGLVTDVHSNFVTLLLPQGAINVQLDSYFENELALYQKAIARIRGVLYAVWNRDTREVRVGHVLMRNARLSIDTPAPADRFDAPLKSPRELFLFDPAASAFQRVRVRGQVIGSDDKHVFIMIADAGIRVIPSENATLNAGDLVEAVGYPEISGPSPVLREAFIRKVGAEPLPEARGLNAAELVEERLDSTRVKVEARLVGLHTEQGVLILEVQAGNRLFFARVPAAKLRESLQVGSRLAIAGVYVAQDAARKPGAKTASFELLANSPADVVVLSRPPWWNLERLLTLMGALLVVLALAVGWIALLRRRVDQRTRQLQHEIRERERAERERAIEAERSRIARDLHDDLGSSLTEIGVLASTGQRQLENGGRGGLFRDIATKARGLVAALDVIVWAVDPEDNSLQSLADYLSGFVEDFLTHSGLSCRFRVPVTLPVVILDGQVRHALLMAVKESLNNIVKHAQATEVEFSLAANDHMLQIVVADNGKGFDVNLGRDGHGLKNLPARLTKSGGTCHVQSVVDHGTTVKICLPLPSGRYVVQGTASL